MKINKELLKGSFVLLVAFGLFNLFNFVFQISMVRLLSIEDYGVLVALSSMVIMTGILTDPIYTVVARYVATQKDQGKTKNLVKRAFKKTFKISLIGYVIFSIAAIPLSILLKIPYILLSLLGVFLFISLGITVSRATLNGKKRFFSLGFNLALEGAIKLVAAIVLVVLGFKVLGSVMGILIGAVVAFGFSLVQIRDLLKEKEKYNNLGDIRSYMGPVSIVTTTIILFYTLDVLIAKMVFEPVLAGSYAFAATLSKILFWGTQPIARALFPISAENSKKIKVHRRAALNATLIISILVVIGVGIMFFFSSQLITLFSGKEITEASDVLFTLSLVAGVLSFVNLVLLYKLSLNRLKGITSILFFVALLIASLFFFSETLIQFSIAYLAVCGFFLAWVIRF